MGRTFKSGKFEIAAISLSDELAEEADLDLEISVRQDERNTSIEFGESYILEMHHRIEIRPQHPAKAGSVPLLGYIELRSRNAEPAILAELHKYLAE